MKPRLAAFPLLVAAWLAAIAAALPAAAAEPVRVDSITWLSGDPRESDAAGGKPFVHTLLPFLRARWPGVAHTIIQANALRAWQLIASGEQVCQPSSVRTPEREKIAYFTDTLLGPPQQLLVRRDKVDALPRNAAGEVDLSRLLADPQLRGALVDGRSYGAGIDNVLMQRPPNPAVTRYAASDFGSKILTMLSIGRADYTIGFDVTLIQEQPHHLPASAPAGAAPLVSEPIAGVSALVRAGVACPRSAWGLAAIRGIDKILGTPAGAALLREEGLRWLTPEARQRYGARIDSFYLERAKPSLIR